MSENKKITNIADYLASLTLQQKELVEEMMKMVKEIVPDTVAVIMWSTLWYKLHEKNFLWFQTATKHVNFGFAYGAQLQSDLLEGTGKNMRHIKIKTMDDLRAKESEITKLLKAAEKLS